jgi:PAS domain S-box-containing protein
MDTHDTGLAGRPAPPEPQHEPNAQVRALMENLPSGVVYADAAGRLRYANPPVARALGVDAREWFGRDVLAAARSLAASFADPAEAERCFADSLAATDSGSHFELRLADGRDFEVAHVRLPASRGLAGHLWQFVDVTARRRLEAQLRQADRMDSIGRLAGGVAHDFNNLLTAMLGYVDLAAMGLPEGAEGRRQLALATEAAEQAAALTRQLLLFARQDPMKPETVDLNRTLARMGPLLRRLLPENVVLTTRPCSTPCWVLADAGQLDQLLMNLALNARDAMPDGGALSLAVGCTAGVPGAPKLATLEVADTGVGMPDEVRRHIFEPFFTTKERGRGTGLGLSTVYGIVQHCGGRIDVQSAPGSGTCVRVALPLADAPAGRATVPALDALPRGHETVLAVEDDPVVRTLLRSMLEHLGYRVLIAADAQEALALDRSLEGPLDLLLTDVIMPGLSGRELASRLREARPGLKVLLVSGYVPRDGQRPAAGHEFLPKPFTIDVLAARLRTVLGSPGTRRGA